ncbi:MAG: DUF1566 domain-containing protein [Nitrospira sp.]|nr:DUF1566 domain-containing protein [Nitrospira sp.]
MAKYDSASLSAAFDVFISYSRVDVRLARALHAALERYQVPSHLSRPSRRISVFRDETAMSGTRYYESIDAHLRQSRKMLLICSPAARRSEFVCDEIRRFLGTHSINDIVPVIASGWPNNEAPSDDLKAFPDLLGDMPLAANLSTFEPRRHRLQDLDWSEAWHLILANVLDVERATFEVEVNVSHELGRAEALRLWELASTKKGDENLVEALLHAAAAHAIMPDSELKISLGIATIALFPRIVVDRVLTVDAPLRGLRFNRDGSQLIGWSASGRVQLIDVVSGKVLASAIHPGEILNAAFLHDGSVVTYGGGGITIIQKSLDVVTWDAPFFIARVVEAPIGDLLALTGPQGEVCLWSRRLTGPIQVKKFWGDDQALALFNHDGNTLLATNGSSVLQLEHTGDRSWIQLPTKFVVHQAVAPLGSFLVSDSESIQLVACLPESVEAATMMVAKNTAQVVAARLGPNLTRLCWIDQSHVLYSRDWFVYRDDDDLDRDADDGRMFVRIKPDQHDLEFWNGDAVAVAYGDHTICALAANGEMLWEREFDHCTALGGLKVHSDLGILSRVDSKLSHTTYIDLADGSVLETRRAVRPAGYVDSCSAGQIAAASGENSLRLASLRRRRADEALRRYYDVSHILQVGNRILAAFEQHDRTLRILDAVSGEPAFPVLNTVMQITDILITPDHLTALTLDMQRRLHLWRRHGFEAQQTPLPLGVPVEKTSVTEAGDLIAVATGADISIMAVDERVEVVSSMVHAKDERIMHLQLGPAGATLASASQNVVRLWNPRTGRPISDSVIFEAPVVALGFTPPDGHKLVAWSLDNSFVIIDVMTGKAIRRVHPGPDTVMEAGIKIVTMSSDGSLLFTAGADRSMRIWDVATGDEVAEPAVHPFRLAGIAASDNVERILTWGADVVSTWNPWSGSKAGPDIEVPDLVSSAFWTLDNARVAVMEGTSLSLFDPETSLLVAGPWHHGGKEFSARFVDDMLVTWTNDGLASVWGFESAKGVIDWRPTSEYVTSVAFDINRRVLSPLNGAEHARIDMSTTRSVLNLVYDRREMSRAVAVGRFLSARPLTEAAVHDLLVGEQLFDLHMSPVGRIYPVEPFSVSNLQTGGRDTVVIQRSQGLMWQVRGSDRLNFEGAVAYVRSMNAARFAGFDDWRLPRLHEAAATLSPTLTGRLHIVAGLGEEEDIWTSDTIDGTNRWIVHYRAGRVGPVSADSVHFVRLVRSYDAPMSE